MKTALAALTVTLTAALTVTSMPAASAAPVSPAPTTLTVAVPAQVQPGQNITVRTVLTDSATTTGITGAAVRLFRGLPNDTISDPVVATGSTDVAGAVDLTAPADRTRPYAHYYAQYDATTDHAGAVSTAGRTRLVGVAVGTTTTLVAPAQATMRRPVTLHATVSGAGDPDTTGVIRFEQHTPSGWATLTDAPVTPAGAASISTAFASSTNKVRATYLGADGYNVSSSPVTTVTGVAQPSTVKLKAPKSVVDEKTLQLSARVSTPYAVVPDALVSFQIFQDKKWRTYDTARTNSAGDAKVSSKPRSTYKYRAVVAADSWFTDATSASATVKNTPPGRVIKKPKGAPTPRKLPVQSRASGDGANATVTTLSTPVWNNMVGRSWRSGCPVGRNKLRLVRVNYWGFDGYRHRGELVVHQGIAAKTARAFTDLYKNKVSLRAMYRVDRFGYSSRLRGANDYASMAADNTSAFNCRNVVGRPGVRSPHATGRSIDINPFENPYRSRADGWVPNSWWHTRSAGTYAWTKRSHLVPKIMKRNGFRWTYGNSDAQHFDG